MRSRKKILTRDEVEVILIHLYFQKTLSFMLVFGLPLEKDINLGYPCFRGVTFFLVPLGLTIHRKLYIHGVSKSTVVFTSSTLGEGL